MKIEEIRAKLEGKQGPEYWKTLDELADDAELRRWMDDEFPNRASLATINRRELLKAMGASLALAGLGGCRGLFMPQRKLVPYVDGPDATTYGEIVYFRSGLTQHGYGIGLHVSSREGRPIKVDGSPDHPAALGACDVVGQASLLTFYDPDRMRMATFGEDVESWDRFYAAFSGALNARRGDGVRILTETVTSSTTLRQLRALLAAYPGVRWHQYEPVNRDNVYAGTRLAFGAPYAPIYRFDRASTILAVDFDLSDAAHGGLAYGRQIMDGRRVERTNGRMNRVYSVQSTPTLIGVVADHSQGMSPAEVETFLRGVAAAVGVPGAAAAPLDPWGQAVARDLLANRGRSVVAVGELSPPTVQALVHAVNARLGAVGTCVAYVPPVETDPGGQAASLKALAADMEAGSVAALLVLGGNPAFATPPGLGFADALAKVPLKAYHGLHANETALRCDWRLPQTHFLEEWGDARAFDGTVTLIQPLIAPLYGGQSANDLLGQLAGAGLRADHLVRATWGDRFRDDTTWREALRVGLIPGSAFAPASPGLAAGFAAAALPAAPSGGTTLILRPDPYVRDGSHANNGWLQEMPRPHTGLTWDNAVLLSPRMAERLGVENGDHVEVAVGKQAVRGPVWITPGHADGCATIPLGFGRSAGGAVAVGPGFDAYPLQPDASAFQAEASIRKVDGHSELVTTQLFHRMEGRDLIHEFDSARLGSIQPGPAPKDQPGFYDLTGETDVRFGRPQWGMTIDLNTCIGCNACVQACQAENNIPVVGKAQVAVGRQMHWIRIDRYYRGGVDQPRTYFQPVPCMHCETAPCEPVCPVAATVHSHEGLNQMIYNRCVGTRYCSNNCPYKVRRFNFLNYQDLQPNYERSSDLPLLRLLNNPDVTVRSRGVMEKCSYCVQRIDRARIKAKEEERPIRDGEVVTACAQACPTRTIVFGDISDPESEVHGLRNDRRSYALLDELNTKPRTTYLAKVRNANPEIEEPHGA